MMQYPNIKRLFRRLLIPVLVGAMSIVQAADPVPVTVTRPQVEPLQEDLPLTGTITSKRQAALSPRISGLISRVNVDAGSEVKRGDVLIEMDSALAKIAMERAAAALSEGKVALEEAKRLDLEAQDLLKKRSIPETTALARKADVELKQASLLRLQAEYRQQYELLERHKIIAPFDGVISQKLAEAGEWVNTGTAVLTLVSIDELQLDVQAPQEYYPRLNKMTPVNIYLDAFPDKVFEGRIETTVPVNIATVRTFLVRILIDNFDHDIIPGMSAQAVFKVPYQTDVITLPRDAIVKHADGRSTVWVIKKDKGKTFAREFQVIPGKTLANRVVIKSGLEPESLVIIKGNETLTNGQAVDILNPDDTSNH